ncbi:Csac_0668 family 2Fe-2S cluster-binding (seleno)protein [Clostridium hydrogeniformans]|uniref:Csac_0668 family 2Fe-2S cluster-binding (seleno)protein n=1 Tax=Clostridium hydrogeniformans TaxID=349933 RepID=UPI0004884E42|nr:(2Fe-2S)-binding protein [Clostridium hydrogeniformans]
MVKSILNKSSYINIKKSSCKIEKSHLCPVCKKQGAFVKNITVKHMVIDELLEQIDDNEYFLCMNEDCNITYYNTESNMKFNKHQVKVPIWFKKDANPKYACYCSEVTEEQIINAVLKNDATNMKEVLRITGAMSNSKCQNKNPLGKCCHQVIQDVIDKALSIK